MDRTIPCPPLPQTQACECMDDEILRFLDIEPEQIVDLECADARPRDHTQPPPAKQAKRQSAPALHRQEDRTEETVISGINPYPSEAQMIPGGFLGEELRQFLVFGDPTDFDKVGAEAPPAQQAAGHSAGAGRYGLPSAVGVTEGRLHTQGDPDASMDVGIACTTLAQVSPAQQAACQLADAGCDGVPSISGITEDGLLLQGDPDLPMDLDMVGAWLSQMPAMQQAAGQFAGAGRNGVPSIEGITENTLQTQGIPKEVVDWNRTLRDVPELFRQKPNYFSSAKMKLIVNQFQDQHDKAIFDKSFVDATRLVLGLFSSHVSTCAYSIATSERDLANVAQCEDAEPHTATNAPSDSVRVNLQVSHLNSLVSQNDVLDFATPS